MVAPWQLCRQYCCRYGVFPILVVPIVTFGGLLSLYSSTGCKFVDLDIGFQPANEGWEATEPYTFGALFYHNSTIRHDSMYRQSIHSGCVPYSGQMYDDYISNDRTFKMIQIMTLISIGASGLAMLVSWLFLISPIPAGCLWPGLLLPAIMVAFIAEGSKFLIFDTAVCRSAMWYRGSLLVPERADSCSMGETAWFACAAGVLHLWALVCVCTRNPEERVFDRSLEPLVLGDVDKDQVEEETSDALDLEGGAGGSNGDSHIAVAEDKGPERGDGKNSNNDENNNLALALTNAFVMDSQNCDGTEMALQLMPIQTTNMSGSRCCSPMSDGKAGATPKSPENAIPEIPARTDDAPLSPVDFIIEGFDIATDLSQIDVCKTMSWLPTQPPPKMTLEGSEAKATEATSISNATADLAVQTPHEYQQQSQEPQTPPAQQPEAHQESQSVFSCNSPASILPELPPAASGEASVRTTFLRLSDDTNTCNSLSAEHGVPTPEPSPKESTTPTSTNQSAAPSPTHQQAQQPGTASFWNDEGDGAAAESIKGEL